MEISLAAALWIKKRGDTICLHVARGGCAGLVYIWSRVPSADDIKMVCMHDVTLYTDSASAQFLDGAQVVLRTTHMGCGLEISNPEAKRSCRCSKSFIHTTRDLSKVALRSNMMCMKNTTKTPFDSHTTCDKNYR